MNEYIIDELDVSDESLYFCYINTEILPDGWKWKVYFEDGSGHLESSEGKIFSVDIECNFFDYNTRLIFEDQIRLTYLSEKIHNVEGNVIGLTFPSKTLPTGWIWKKFCNFSGELVSPEGDTYFKFYDTTDDYDLNDLRDMTYGLDEFSGTLQYLDRNGSVINQVQFKGYTFHVVEPLASHPSGFKNHTDEIFEKGEQFIHDQILIKSSNKF